ncbi:spermidine synthase [Georgenia sp. 10Sc9-8]|uniref:Spermidine synthase n=1 Tax=Georgenia halotolerans TaxID=3028317 RepID=A0ABT5TYR1_9MICO|nr:spermidine synthase [Georgenia halotolerans]
MSTRFEELDWRPTRLGDLSLRRRWDPFVEREVHEVKLGDEFLMSSLFTAAEVELARLALARLPGDDLDVVVGGLGLGFTAREVLASSRVRSLTVVEALAPVIDWHRRGLVPGGTSLAADPRCRLVHGDFIEMVLRPDGLDAETPGRLHAVVVDIDHSPRHVLHPSHTRLYERAGTGRLAAHLSPGGVFALWSNDPPDEDYLGVLGGVLTDVTAETVRFPNPLQDREATNTVYLASAPGADLSVSQP